MLGFMSLRTLTSLTLALAAFGPRPAIACTAIEDPHAERRAFEKADLVITVDAVSEKLLPVPGEGSLRVGFASGKILQMHKGRRELKGREITYRVVEGSDGLSCPAVGSTRPGARYKLYLSFFADGGPPLIIRREVPPGQ